MQPAIFVHTEYADVSAYMDTHECVYMYVYACLYTHTPFACVKCYIRQRGDPTESLLSRRPGSKFCPSVGQRAHQPAGNETEVVA